MKAKVIKEIKYGYDNIIKTGEIVEIIKVEENVVVIKYGIHRINVRKDKIEMLE